MSARHGSGWIEAFGTWAIICGLSVLWTLTGALSLICVALAFIPAHLASWISRAFEWSSDEIGLRLDDVRGL